MKLISLIVTVIVLVLFCASVFALDWKNLHKTADEISISEAQELVRKSKDLPEALYVAALVYLNEYKVYEAKSLFLRIQKRAPETLEAKWGLAEISRREYDIQKSREALRQIIISNPDFSPAYITLAYIEFSLKNYKEAVKLAAVVINQGTEVVDLSNYVRAYLILAGAKGMIADRSGPLAKAFHGLQVLPNLKRAKRLQPESPGVYFGLGAFYLLAPAIAGGDIIKAKEHLEKAILLDPNLVDAYVRLAQVYRAQGDMKRFQEYLRLALEKDPQNYLANELRDSLQ
ncbi:MAG: tetratricopeptide repeat protein [Candidatus Omnitrophica bacterium]|nr:tetratricopeptide repeat protein [Candidatus Omnitrophota bacterium]